MEHTKEFKRDVWKIWTTDDLPEMENPLLIVGPPSGAGNVGRITAEYIIDTLGARKVAEFNSHLFPYAAYISGNNLVEAPKIEVYHLKGGKRDYLVVTGNIQPREQACYQLSEIILDYCKAWGVKEVVVLAGMALAMRPKDPQVFCTGNTDEIIERYAVGVERVERGTIGGIIGLAGVIMGQSQGKEIESLGLMVESSSDDFLFDVAGASELLKTIEDVFEIGLDKNRITSEAETIVNSPFDSGDQPERKVDKTYIG